MSREEYIAFLNENDFTREEIKEWLDIVDEFRGDKELTDYTAFIPMFKDYENGVC